MGANTSKTVEDSSLTDEKIVQEIESKKVLLDKALVDNINNLNEILDQFNKNDTQGIVDKIKGMDNFKGKLPDSILGKVGDVHKTLLDSLDSNLSYNDKKKQIETDKALATYIQKFVDKDLDTKMKDYLQNPFIQGDPIVARSMTDVTNSIKTIRKYKYFEYKYVQMNMFLILFTDHVHNTIKKFIDETAAFYAAREKYHLVLIHNVIKTFQEQLGDETKKMTDINTEDFTKTISELTRNVMDSITQQKQISEKMKNESLAEILKFLMERETEFAQELVKSVESYKLKNPTDNKDKSVPTDINLPVFIPSKNFIGPKKGYKFTNDKYGVGYYLNTGLISQPVYGPENRPRYIPPSSYQGQQGYRYRSGSLGSGYYLTGGFVRDGSLLPKNFYEIK